MLEHHNNTALIVTASTFIIGSVLRAVNSLPSVPINLLSYLQALSFTIAIIAGIITIIKKSKE